MFTKEIILDAIEKGIIDGDGHSIVPSSFYLNAGFDCSGLEVEHKSDMSSAKSTISVGGSPVASMKGVSSLSFHKWVAAECGLIGGRDYRDDFYGRGKQARAIVEALHNWATDGEGE